MTRSPPSLPTNQHTHTHTHTHIKTEIRCEEICTFGITSFLTEYTYKKRFQTLLRRLIYRKQAVACVSVNVCVCAIKCVYM
jgi:hypothetical protein